MNLEHPVLGAAIEVIVNNRVPLEVKVLVINALQGECLVESSRIGAIDDAAACSEPDSHV